MNAFILFSILFSDVKQFVSASRANIQNDRVYMPKDARKRRMTA